MANYLGHGISYNLIEENKAENAYHILEMQHERVFIPKEYSQGVFCILVRNSIDMKQGILSGEQYFLVSISRDIVAIEEKKIIN